MAAASNPFGEAPATPDVFCSNPFGEPPPNLSFFGANDDTDASNPFGEVQPVGSETHTVAQTRSGSITFVNPNPFGEDVVYDTADVIRPDAVLSLENLDEIDCDEIDCDDLVSESTAPHSGRSGPGSAVGTVSDGEALYDVNTGILAKNGSNIAAHEYEEAPGVLALDGDRGYEIPQQISEDTTVLPVSNAHVPWLVCGTRRGRTLCQCVGASAHPGALGVIVRNSSVVGSGSECRFQLDIGKVTLLASTYPDCLQAVPPRRMSKGGTSADCESIVVVVERPAPGVSFGFSFKKLQLTMTNGSKGDFAIDRVSGASLDKLQVGDVIQVGCTRCTPTLSAADHTLCRLTRCCGRRRGH